MIARCESRARNSAKVTEHQVETVTELLRTTSLSTGGCKAGFTLFRTGGLLRMTRATSEREARSKAGVGTYLHEFGESIII